MSAQPKILMASPNHWTSAFQVGSHHLARGFARRGWDVAFLSDPISPLHLLGGSWEDLRERLAIYRAGGMFDVKANVWSYVPGALATPRAAPVLRSRWLHRNWQRLTAPNALRVVRDRGFGVVDVLYFDSAMQRFWLDAIPHKRSVLRIADRTAGFRRYTAEMIALERELANEVDLVVFAASTADDYVEMLRPRRTMHLPNGIDFGRYAVEEPREPADLHGIRRPIAIYVGAIEEWFGFATINEMTDALPDVSFVLVGPDRLARRRLVERPNVHLLGRRPNAQIPALLRHSQVGLIPFDVAGHPELVHGIHPLKLYEYLASGLPVVASEWDELAALHAPIRLCRTTEEHIEAVRSAIETPPDTAAGTAFAAAADWQRRVNDLVGELFSERPAGPT